MMRRWLATLGVDLWRRAGRSASSAQMVADHQAHRATTTRDLAMVRFTVLAAHLTRTEATRFIEWTHDTANPPRAAALSRRPAFFLRPLVALLFPPF